MKLNSTHSIGFSGAKVESWLRVHDVCLNINIAGQRQDKNSEPELLEEDIRYLICKRVYVYLLIYSSRLVMDKQEEE